MNNPVNRLFALSLLMVLSVLIGAVSTGYAENSQNAELHVDLKGPTKAFSPVFAGLMTEEINHSYDGGLYGELIRNRVFRDNETNAEAWSLSVPPEAEATMAVTDKWPLTDKLPKSLEVVITKVATTTPVEIANTGYWGIPVKPDTTYKVSFYAKGNNGWEKKKGDPDVPLFRAPLTISLRSNDGSKVYGSLVTQPLTGEWQKFDLTLTTPKDIQPSKENKFVISADTVGTFRLSLVSLFPPTYKNRTNGNRIDLMEKMAALQPKFLRFPGGNFLEGDNLWERFNWKETVGPLEFRPGHTGCWEYRASDGLGLLEFMGWCEDLGIEPVLAVYAGYSLKEQAVQPGPLLQPYLKDALEEIEYLTGDAKSTYWGVQRAQDGHPEPFKLHYIEIGNEDWFDRTGSYNGRFAQYYDAFKAKYPDLQLIATAPVKSRKPDVIDEHFYKPTDWFVKQFNHYDKTDRNGPKIFVGEWATMAHEAWTKDKKQRSNTPYLFEALGDAAWMCAMERNADIVIMQCYAPLFTNENPGATQWKPDLIGFDALSSYGSPAWHAQVLFNSHRGDEVLTADLKQGDPKKTLPYSVTRDKANGVIYIKLVNPGAETRQITIDLGDGTAVESKAEVTTLTSKDPTIANSLDHPDAVVPVTSVITNVSSKFPMTLSPSSLTILTLKLK